jgi:hypothetical protein
MMPPCPRTSKCVRTRVQTRTPGCVCRPDARRLLFLCAAQDTDDAPYVPLRQRKAAQEERIKLRLQETERERRDAVHGLSVCLSVRLCSTLSLSPCACV